MLKEILARYSESQIDLIFNPESSDIFSSVDPVLFKHIINNLLTNALKFSKSRVDIVLESNDTQEVIIHIADDGPGILSDQQHEIFEPFNTLETSPSNEHIGLGLSIAKSIAELHNGTIRVSKSTHLGGACFSVTIPDMIIPD